MEFDERKKAASGERFRAEAALEAGRADEAEEFARAALAVEPASPQAHGLLSQALLLKGRHEEAISEAEAGLALAPLDTWLHRIHALALSKADQPRALAAAEEAMRLAPELGSAHYLVAVLLKDVGRNKEAIEAIERALQIEPADATYKRTLAELYLDIDPARAELLYRECLNVDSKDALLLHRLGTALDRQQRPREAAVAYQAAVLADPAYVPHARPKNSALKIAAAIASTAIAAMIIARASSVARVVLALLALAGIVVVVIIAKRKPKEANVEDADPQLRAIYEELARDRKPG